MAEITDREIRMIQDIHAAVNNMSTMLNETRNLAREIRGYTYGSANSDMLTAVNDVRNSVNAIRNDASHVNQTLTNLMAATGNFTALQQFLARIESNTQGANGVMLHVEQIRNDVASLQQVLSNLEQFMNDVSVYVQDIQSQLSNLTSTQKQLHVSQQQLMQEQQEAA